MLKSFRRRFILMTMLLVGAVSLIAFASVGVSSYQQLRQEVDNALERAVNSDSFVVTLPNVGYFVSGIMEDSEGVTAPEDERTNAPEGEGTDGSDDNTDSEGESSGFSKIPVVSVTVNNSDPTAIIFNANSTAQMDSSLCSSAVTAVLESGKDSGALDDYGLYYKMRASTFGYQIAFADSSSVIEETGEETIKLLGLWLLLMAAVFIICLFLARYVARPVEQAWKDQQRFIADASHELKTPLTIIMADASILADNPTKTVAEQSVWVEGITVEAARMKELTEGMLTLAQADANADVDKSKILSDVDMSSIVESQVLQFDAVAFERGLVIEENIETGLHVKGDALRLETMTKTLLENACKYAAPESTIRVKLAKHSKNAVLTVHNDGDAIPESDLPHLFDRFYRSDEARARDGETASFGLGLSIAKSTAEMHGGTIGVTSGDSGTSFTVSIPLAK